MSCEATEQKNMFIWEITTCNEQQSHSTKERNKDFIEFFSFVSTDTFWLGYVLWTISVCYHHISEMTLKQNRSIINLEFWTDNF